MKSNPNVYIALIKMCFIAVKILSISVVFENSAIVIYLFGIENFGQSNP